MRVHYRNPPPEDYITLFALLHPHVAKPGPHQHPSGSLSRRQQIVLNLCPAAAVDGNHLLPAQAVMMGISLDCFGAGIDRIAASQYSLG